MAFGYLSVGPTTRVAILTGAGVSAAKPTRLKTFRGPGGLRNNPSNPYVRYSSIKEYEANKREANFYYDEFLKRAQETKPNAAHRALNDLKERLGSRVYIVDLNVDGLLPHASPLHGRVNEIFCTGCGVISKHPEPLEEIYDQIKCTTCNNRKMEHRRNMILYGEGVHPFLYESAVKAIENSNIFIAVGTELATAHARFLAMFAQGRKNVQTVLINKTKPNDVTVQTLFQKFHKGCASKLVPQLCNHIIKQSLVENKTDK